MGVGLRWGCGPAAGGHSRDAGRDLVRDWGSEAHMAIQGVTRSGKSRFVYGFLGQLAESPLVTVAGCDRPSAGRGREGWCPSGAGRAAGGGGSDGGV